MNVKTFLAAIALCALVPAARAQVSAAERTPVIGEQQTAPSADNGPVGISARDGISISDKDVIITRNGVSEILKAPLDLPNHVRVFPDGTVTMPDAGRITLRAEQLITLDGRLVNIVRQRPASNPPLQR